MSSPRIPLPDSTYVVLVCSLFQTLVPTALMAVAFVGVSAHIVAQTPDVLLSTFRAVGVAVVIGRLVVLLLYRAKAAN